MSSEAEEITVQLMGKTFCMRANKEKQAALQTAIVYLNEQMRLIKGNSSVIGFERVLTLTAINLVDEMLNGGDGSKHQLIDLTERLNKLNAKVSSALEGLKEEAS